MISLPCKKGWIFRTLCSVLAWESLVWKDNCLVWLPTLLVGTVLLFSKTDVIHVIYYQDSIYPDVSTCMLLYILYHSKVHLSRGFYSLSSSLFIVNSSVKMNVFLTSLTAARCPRPTDRPIARGADPVTSLRLLSVTAMTHRTSWSVARNSMAKPLPALMLFSWERQETVFKMIGSKYLFIQCCLKQSPNCSIFQTHFR